MFDDELLYWLQNGRFTPKECVELCLQALRTAETLIKWEDFQLAQADTQHRMTDAYNILDSVVQRIVIADPTCYDIRKLPTRSLQGILDQKTRYFRLLQQHTWMNRCHGPGCIQTEPGCSRRFQRCSGCQQASYCSKVCQRSAWRYPGAPHRDVCSTMGSYKEFTALAYRNLKSFQAVLAHLPNMIDDMRAEVVLANLLNLHKSQFVVTRKISLSN
jgi:hypothetical protein